MASTAEAVRWYDTTLCDKHYIYACYVLLQLNCAVSEGIRYPLEV
jgi:hypothetical protein